MRRRKSESFTVYTARGAGSYRSRAKADAAARWVAHETGDSVSVMNENTGQSWEVSVGDATDPRDASRPVVDHRIPSTLALTA
jgi:hypothetical protein